MGQVGHAEHATRLAGRTEGRNCTKSCTNLDGHPSLASGCVETAETVSVAVDQTIELVPSSVVVEGVLRSRPPPVYRRRVGNRSHNRFGARMGRVDLNLAVDPTYRCPGATKRFGASTEWLRRAVRGGEGSASTSGENAARWNSAAARALSGGA
jgi:hypothetical protein